MVDLTRLPDMALNDDELDIAEDAYGRVWNGLGDSPDLHRQALHAAVAAVLTARWETTRG